MHLDIDFGHRFSALTHGRHSQIKAARFEVVVDFDIGNQSPMGLDCLANWRSGSSCLHQAHSSMLVSSHENGEVPVIYVVDSQLYLGLLEKACDTSSNP
jgi:hypothetical protein